MPTSKQQPILRSFSERLVELRARKGMSQEELADRAGLHRTQIGRLERMERLPTLLTLGKIADGLGVTLSELLRGVSS